MSVIIEFLQLFNTGSFCCNSSHYPQEELNDIITINETNCPAFWFEREMGNP